MGLKLKKENLYKSILFSFIHDESGQATTEYVLLLAVLAGTILSVGSAFRKKLHSLLEGRLGTHFKNQFSESRIHQFRM